jgi:hypothetical protein
MSSRRQPRSLARRATAALLVGVWLAGLVGSIFHDANHEHRYCSQHGTFEEAGAAAALTGASATSAPDPTEKSLRPGDATLRGDTHEPCAFADLGVRAPLTETTTLAVAQPAPPAPTAALPRGYVAAPIPLLAFAPKASPPALLV